MHSRFWAILNTILFTIVVPGTVAILIPRWLVGGYFRPENAPLTWLWGVSFSWAGRRSIFVARGSLPFAAKGHRRRLRLRNI